MNAQTPSSPRTLVEVEDLRTWFPVRRGIFSRVVGNVKAVDGLSFRIHAGETFGLVGESGCGKTTVGRSLLRLNEPTSGRVTYDGRDVTQMDAATLRALRPRMQMIFQDPYSSLNPRMTVGELVAEAVRVHRIVPADQVDAHVAACLERVGLQASYVSRYPHEFSGGQRQRIGIARALALRPEFLVCDEAVSALDVSVQAQVLNLLADLQRELGLSYLFISHDLSVVRHVSDRIGVMYLGKLVEVTTAARMFDRPAHPYSVALLSAVPRPDPRLRGDRIVLQGDVPSPLSPPTGCAFHPRCPMATEACRRLAPTLREVEPGHWIACHLHQQVPGGPAAVEGCAEVAERVRAAARGRG